MKESIAEFREVYDVESPEDLVIKVEPGDEGGSDVGQWQSTRRNLAISKAAIRVGEAHRLAEAEV